MDTPRQPTFAAHARLAWALLPPVALLTWLAARWLGPLLAGPPPDPAGATALFTALAGDKCFPTRPQQIGYLLSISVPAILLFLSFVLLPKHLLEKIPEWGVRAGQAALLAFAGSVWFIQLAHGGKFYFNRKLLFLNGPLPTLLFLLAAAALFLWNRRRALAPPALPAPAPWICAALAAFFTAAGLLPAIQTVGTIGNALGSLFYHIPFPFGEFAAVENGRTLLVDFFPQYQNLLPYLLHPFFKLFGFGLGPFTTAMALLSFAGLMLTYLVFRAVSPRWAILLYLPYLALVLTPVNAAGGYYSGTYTYFAAAPLRFLAPWVLAFLLSLHLRRPGGRSLAFLFGAGALLALNNLDFGLPALVAVAVAAGLASPRGLTPGFRFLSRLALGAGCALAAAVILYFAFTRLRSGQWPDFRELFSFQRAFAVYGLLGYPMPPVGIQYLLYLLLMASLWSGLARIAGAAGAADPGAERHLGGLLLFYAISGCGEAMYYVGHPHDHLVVVMFTAAGVPLMLLAYAHFRQGWASALAPRGAIPALLLAFGCAVAAGQWEKMPAPWTEAGNLFRTEPAFGTREAAEVELIRSTAAPGSAVAVCYPYGHWLAQQAGVRNFFPFANRESLILVEQIALTARAIDAHGITRFYGAPAEELAGELARRGFTRQTSPLLDAMAPFEFWKRGD